MTLPPQHDSQGRGDLGPGGERQERKLATHKKTRQRTTRYYELLAKAVGVLEPKDGEKLLETSYCLPIRCAIASGLHLVLRQPDGSYAVCKLTVVPAVLLYLGACTLALGNMGIKIYRGLFTFNTMVMVMPIIIGCIFIVLICAVLLSKTTYTVRYMESLQEAGLSVRPTLKAKACVTASFIFAILNSYITLSLIPDSSRYLMQIILPVLLNSLVPYLLDIYIWVFTSGLSYSWAKLETHVLEKTQWWPADVETVAATWLTLTRLLALHNQVC